MHSQLHRKSHSWGITEHLSLYVACSRYSKMEFSTYLGKDDWNGSYEGQTPNDEDDSPCLAHGALVARFHGMHDGVVSEKRLNWVR
ncbi:hypothetical protein CEXT_743791 [Caerostris extrusa]|uniref:Uncharacterized protein n=1 Tax=Caerostris extrusa TaxID=172846 RepID=A0AAV4RIV8_CAEEX|nr:hypothetical protein CEXT_743791 [Caerostris extrusa]